MIPVLDSHVLVLNRFFMPVHMVTVRRAFLLLCRDRAEVVDEDNGQFAHYDFLTWQQLSILRDEIQYEGAEWIQTVSHALQIPRVVRLTEFEQFSRQTLRFSRRNLFARDHQQCQDCGRNLTMSQMSMDHVVPRRLGGETTWDNVVCACVSCNTRKGGRTPKQAHMRLKTNPVKPDQQALLDVSIDHPRYDIWQTFLPRHPDLAETASS